MRGTTVIYVKHEKSLKNRIGNLMHEIGMFKIVHELRIGSGEILTVKGPAPVRFILDRMYAKEVAPREPFRIR